MQLRYFAAVARRENMTAAAAELNVTQSTLSSAMSHLEREFGTALFTRLPSRRLRLTSAGRALLGSAAAFLEQAELLSQSVRDDADTLSGEIVVGIYAPLAPFRAPIILQRFERLHPGVTVTFLEGDQGSLQGALSSGACEVALMYDLGVDHRFVRKIIDRVPPHIIVGAGHPAAQHRERPVSLRDFAAEPLILLDLPHTREYYLGLFKHLGVEPTVRHVSLGYETVRSFVALGHGYSVLNQWVDHGMTYAGAQVIPLTLSDALPPTETSLVRLASVVPTRKALAFESVYLSLYGPQSRPGPAAAATVER